jgi:hypothetical protein
VLVEHLHLRPNLVSQLCQPSAERERLGQGRNDGAQADDLELALDALLGVLSAPLAALESGGELFLFTSNRQELRQVISGHGVPLRVKHAGHV